VNLSFTLARNEKVKHYIRIKTYKLIALRFWVDSGVNALCVWTLSLIGICSPQENPLCKPNKWYQSRWLKPAQTSVGPCIKSLPGKDSKQVCPVKMNGGTTKDTRS